MSQLKGIVGEDEMNCPHNFPDCSGSELDCDTKCSKYDPPEETVKTLIVYEDDNQIIHREKADCILANQRIKAKIKISKIEHQLKQICGFNSPPSYKTLAIKLYYRPDNFQYIIDTIKEKIEQ